MFVLPLAVLLVVANSASAAADSGTKSLLSNFILGTRLRQVNNNNQVVQPVEPNVVLHQEQLVASQQQQQQVQQLQPQPVLVSGQSSGVVEGQQQQQYFAPVHAAVQSRRYLQLVPYLNSVATNVQPQIIEVDAITAPIQFLFRSASGPLLFQQVHVPAAAQPAVHHTRSEEQPQLLTHEVYKPVVQDLREIIQPFRRITQEVKPVLEEVHTLVAKGEQQSVAPAGSTTLAETTNDSAQPLASSQSVVTSSSSTSSTSSTTSTTTAQVSGLKTNPVVEPQTDF